MATNHTGIGAFVHAQAADTSFSGVIVVQERGETIFTHASGFANRSDVVPNTLDTRFGTASGSKTFTAVAICQLVARGLLSFLTPLQECIGVRFPAFDPNVTIHHLLTHTSGIPDYFDESVMDDFAALWNDLPVYRLRTPADFLPLFQDKPMLAEPGAGFHYNNAGFIVLALVVEHLTGMPFPEYVTEHVFGRAGMTRSGYFATDQLPAQTALGYVGDAAGSRSNIFAVPIIGGGDGGAYVTAGDTLRFWTSLRNETLLPSAIATMMLTPHVQEDERSAYGYGLWITLDGSGAPAKYVLSGGDPGVRFYASCQPAHDRYVVAIANTETGPAAIGRGIEQVLANAGAT